jgi:hypothetical protein
LGSEDWDWEQNRREYWERKGKEDGIDKYPDRI